MKTVRPILFPIAFLALPLLVYLPALITDYGMHNDYRFLPGNFQDRKPFVEAEHLYIVGRPLQSVLINVQGWCINRIADLKIARWISWAFMMGFAGLFYRFLRRRIGLEAFWSAAIVMGMVMLPSSEIYGLWACHFLPGYFTLFFSLSSYLVFDAAWRNGRGSSAGHKLRAVVLAALSALLFWIALFNYPINGIFVFVCTFACVFFSHQRARVQAFKIVVRDLVFFGACMVVYFGANVFFFIPHAPPMTASHPMGGTPYDFRMTLGLWQKSQLLIETFLVSLGGVWHTAFGHAGAMVNGMMIALSLGILCCRKRESAAESKSRAVELVFLMSMVILFFVTVNAPALLAKGCFKLIGYRVIFPAATLLLMVQWGLWRTCADSLKESKAGMAVKTLVVGMILASGGMAFFNVSAAAENYHSELNIIQQKILAADFKDVDRILVVTVPTDKGKTLLERSMPFEFGYMINYPDMATPIVDETLKVRGLPQIPVSLDDGNIVFFDPRTLVIDVNEARAVSRKSVRAGTDKPLALVMTSSNQHNHVAVFQEFGVYFLFQEQFARTRVPFWLVKPAPEPAWLQIEFQDQPRMIRSFTWGVYTLKNKYALPVAFRVQGEKDDKRWVDLNVRVARRNQGDKNLALYRIVNPGVYKKYRFSLLPPAAPLLVSKVHMVFAL